MRIALAALLALSLGINAWLFLREPAPGAAAGSPTDASAQAATCQSALAQCEAKRPEAQRSPAAPAAAAPAGLPFELPKSLIETSPKAPAATAGPKGVVSELTPELQQDMLSQVAREKLRDEWKRQEASILKGLRSSLPDAAKQHDDAQREGHKLATEAGLDAATADRFAAAYEAQRLQRMNALLQAITPDPPDWSTAIEQARGLFADEDALMAQLGGDDAKKRLRTAQAEGRTVILAIGASLADAPWEQTVHW
jgi:hypothetical protein